jgi:16S rRNA (cytosine967-C5)-methyltransferase
LSVGNDYSEIADVKEPFDRDNFGAFFAVWAVLRGYPIPDWRQLEGTPERKIKGRFDELSKIRAVKESIPDWMDELGVKELGENYGLQKSPHKTNRQK